MTESWVFTHWSLIPHALWEWRLGLSNWAWISLWSLQWGAVKSHNKQLCVWIKLLGNKGRNAFEFCFAWDGERPKLTVIHRDYSCTQTHCQVWLTGVRVTQWAALRTGPAPTLKERTSFHSLSAMEKRNQTLKLLDAELWEFYWTNEIQKQTVKC